MSWVAVEKDGDEYIFTSKPERTSYFGGMWKEYPDDFYFPNNTSIGFVGVNLPKGAIEKLIGKALTWKDEPVELK